MPAALFQTGRAMSVFDAGNLPDVIHGRARLTVLAFLSAAGASDFVTLRDEINISDGNLSQHLKKLSDAGYISLNRTTRDGRARTVIELSPAGHTAFYAYLDHLRLLLDAIPKPG